MSEFQDRQSVKLNSKILEVSGVEKNSLGEITKLYVKEYRNDTPVTNEGTLLNAENLNSIIKSMIDEAIAEKHKYDGIEKVNKELSITIDGTYNMIDSFSVDISEPVTITVLNEYIDYFTVIVPESSTNATFNVVVEGNDDPDLVGLNEFEFVVELRSQETEDLIKVYLCTILVQIPSTTPDD